MNCANPDAVAFFAIALGLSALLAGILIGRAMER
jgi:hypothetical protein